MGLFDSYLPLVDTDQLSSRQTINVADIAANCVWSPDPEDIKTAIQSVDTVQGVSSVSRELAVMSYWSVDLQPTDGATVGMLRSQIVQALKDASVSSGTGCFSPTVGDITIKQEGGKLPGAGTTAAVSLTAIAVIVVAVIILRR